MSPRDSKPSREAMERLEARNFELARTLQLVEDARRNLVDQYDFAPIGFVTLDVKGCVREINLTAAKLIGRERSQLLTMPFLSHVAKPHIKSFLGHLRRCRTEGVEVLSDIALRAPKGGVLPVELRSVPVLDPQRGDMVFRTAITDITERLRAGEALRESEERYRDLVEFLPDGIFVQCEGRIVFANPAALRLCGGKSESAVIGRPLTDLLCPTFRRGAIKEMLDATVPVPGTPPIEAKLEQPGRSAVDVEIAACAFSHEGKPAVLFLLRDITGRKSAERQAVAASEREQARFGQDLHDGLCQSLAGVACLTEALIHQLRGACSTAIPETEKIAAIIRQCVDEARVLAKGLYPVHMETHGLVPALSQLANDVTHRGRIVCALECDESLSVGDIGVATNLYRIAQEAISNAIKHGAAKSVIIRLSACNGRATLSLQDDGKGFPARPKKTGIGLHAMRYRASMIGGLLDVRRDGARGTVVTCSFPTRNC